jgi:membrane-associated PAP2 superfamily phosphatase
MRVFAWAALFGLIGLVGGYAATLGIGIALMDVWTVSQREGAAAMALAFVFAPLGACVTAIVAATAAAIITRRRQREFEAISIAPRPGWSRRTRGMVGGLAGFALGYGAALLILAVFYQLRGSPYFSSYLWALAAAWSPFLPAGLGAAGGASLAMRGSR